MYLPLSSRVERRLPRSSMKRLALRLLSLTVLAACIAFFLYVLLNNIKALPSLRYDWLLASAFCAAVVLVLVLYALQVSTTHLLLLGLGEKPRLREIAPIILLSQFAKYLPGNVGHFVGRVTLGKQYGYSGQHLLFTIGYEIGWAAVVSVSVAIFALLYSGHELAVGKLPQVPPLWLIGLLVVSVAALPPFGTFILNRWRPAFIEHLLGGRSVKLPSLSITTACMLIYVVVFCINGLGLAILGEGLIGKGLENIVLLIGLFAVAWLAGFVVPGAPGGLGVREAILVASLSPLYGEPAAVALSLGSRIAFIAGDGLAFLAGWIAYRLYPPRGSQTFGKD